MHSIPMIDAAQLIARWQTRSSHGLVGDDSFAQRSRSSAHVIAQAFARVIYQDGATNAADESDPDCEPAAIAAQASESKLSYNEFAMVLQGYQLILIEALAGPSTGEEPSHLESGESYSMLQRSDLLTHACLEAYRNMEARSSAAATSTHTSTGAKTLQHEIRTPLQGALLSSELLLEDVANGDPVALEDVQSIRTSIETAIKVLNEFAKR